MDLSADSYECHCEQYNGNYADPGDDKTHDGFFVGFTNFDVEHKDSSLHPSTDKQWWMDLLSTFLFQHDFNARFTQFVLLPNGCV